MSGGEEMRICYMLCLSVEGEQVLVCGNALETEREMTREKKLLLRSPAIPLLAEVSAH